MCLYPHSYTAQWIHYGIHIILRRYNATNHYQVNAVQHVGDVSQLIDDWLLRTLKIKSRAFETRWVLRIAILMDVLLSSYLCTAKSNWPALNGYIRDISLALGFDKYNFSRLDKDDKIIVIKVS